jgi:hypothetical protein
VAGRYERDPISVQFDEAAARLLRRAYARRGEWTGTYLKNPSIEWQAWALRRNFTRQGPGALLGPDDAPGGEARTRWARAFVRACFHLNKKFMTSHGLEFGDAPRPNGVRPPFSLDYQVGTVRIAPGGRVVGRAVRIRLLTQAEARRFAAAGKVPASKRWVTPDGHAGPRHSDPAARSWG